MVRAVAGGLGAVLALAVTAGAWFLDARSYHFVYAPGDYTRSEPPPPPPWRGDVEPEVAARLMIRKLEEHAERSYQCGTVILPLGMELAALGPPARPVIEAELQAGTSAEGYLRLVLRWMDEREELRPR